MQICSFWGVTLVEMDNFWPFLTPRVPQKGQNLWFVLNELQHENFDHKLYICANF